MKYQVFKAVDKLDGDVSLFAFDEQETIRSFTTQIICLGGWLRSLSPAKVVTGLLIQSATRAAKIWLIRFCFARLNHEVHPVNIRTIQGG